MIRPHDHRTGFMFNGEGSNVKFSIVMIFSSPAETPFIGLGEGFCKEEQPAIIPLPSG